MSSPRWQRRRAKRRASTLACCCRIAPLRRPSRFSPGIYELADRSLRRSRISAALLLAVLAAVGVSCPRSSRQFPAATSTWFPGRRSRTAIPISSVRTNRARQSPRATLAPARRRQRLPHRRSSRPVRSDARVQDGRRRVGRPLQVGRRREELDQHAPARLPAGFGSSADPNHPKYSPLKAYEGATDPVVRAGTNGLFYFAGVAFTAVPASRVRFSSLATWT